MNYLFHFMLCLIFNTFTYSHFFFVLKYFYWSYFVNKIHFKEIRELFYVINIAQQENIHVLETDECLKNGTECQQICVDQINSFNCSCKTGFHTDPSNWKSCIGTSKFNWLSFHALVARGKTEYKSLWNRIQVFFTFLVRFKIPMCCFHQLAINWKLSMFGELQYVYPIFLQLMLYVVMPKKLHVRMEHVL